MREALNLNACGIDTVEATRWSVSQSAAQPAQPRPSPQPLRHLRSRYAIAILRS